MKTKIILAILALSLSVFGLMSCTEEAENSIPTAAESASKPSSIKSTSQSMFANNSNPYDYVGQKVTGLYNFFTEMKDDIVNSSNPKLTINKLYDKYMGELGYSEAEVNAERENIEQFRVSEFKDIYIANKLENSDNAKYFAYIGDAIIGSYNLGAEQDLLNKIFEIENDILNNVVSTSDKKKLLSTAAVVRYTMLSYNTAYQSISFPFYDNNNDGIADNVSEWQLEGALLQTTLYGGASEDDDVVPAAGMCGPGWWVGVGISIPIEDMIDWFEKAAESVADFAEDVYDEVSDAIDAIGGWLGL